MSRLQDKLADGCFVVTTEIAPPKGVDVHSVVETAGRLKGVDAINVTDNQGACMRMSPLAVAGILVAEGYDPVLQITCRDRNRMALQSDILGAAAVGVENLLLLTGDHPGFGDHRAARSVFDLDSVQLLKGVENLQKGTDMGGNRLTSAPRFFVGAAAAPAAEPRDPVMRKVKKKIACGASFFQTQAVFQRDQIESFMTEIKAEKIPVIMGVLLLKGPRMANYLNTNVPGVRVPDSLIQRLDQADDCLAEGLGIAREMVSWAREWCQGVHLMTFGNEDLIGDILAA